MSIPDGLRYSTDHEWVALDGSRAKVGITHYAQDALGDVVYVQLPGAGSTVQAGQTMGEVESTKSVSDLYAPVSGTVVEVNDAIVGAPELLNSDPYGDGWICVVEVSDPTEIEGLLDAAGYRALTEG